MNYILKLFFSLVFPFTVPSVDTETNSLHDRSFPAASNDNFILNDTSKSHLSDSKLLSNDDSLNKIGTQLLQNHPVFTQYWITDEAFVFEDIEFEDMPEETTIRLVQNDESFKLTWYGKINSNFKERWGKFHQGIDINLQTGDPVYAAFDGIVRYAQFNKAGFGNCVIIRHLNGLETVYAHLSKIDVSSNQFVKAGTTIGLGGSTGHSTGPHLHFETRYKDFSFNPLLFIDPSSQSLLTDSLILKKDYYYKYKYGKNHKSQKNKSIDTQKTVDHEYADSATIDKLEAVPVETPAVSSTKAKPAAIDSTPIEQPDVKQTDVKKIEVKKAPVVVTAPQKNNKQFNKTKVSAPAAKNKTKANTAKKSNSKKEPAKAKTYTVKKGESLYTISKKTGVPIKKLQSSNKIKDPNKLKPGDKLKL